MNAFLLFARRRRPEISAENAAMRTGEVSKILSKEWTAMPAVSWTHHRPRIQVMRSSTLLIYFNF
jgi:hypothetical protein